MTTQSRHRDSTLSAGGVPAEQAQVYRQIGRLAEPLWAARDCDELTDTVAEIVVLKSTLQGTALKRPSTA